MNRYIDSNEPYLAACIYIYIHSCVWCACLSLFIVPVSLYRSFHRHMYTHGYMNEYKQHQSIMRQDMVHTNQCIDACISLIRVYYRFMFFIRVYQYADSCGPYLGA